MHSKISKIILYTTIGRKILLAITGFFLFLFLVGHLLGNLPLVLNKPLLFNQYAHSLESMGMLLYIVEVLLVLTFLVHALDALFITLENRKARPIKYYKEVNAGKPSRKGISSTTMIYTGILVLVFLVIHIKTFKYGTHYTVPGSETEMRDLHRLVVEVFHNGWFVLGYSVAMILLGLHLRHAFFSACQSLGIDHPHYTSKIEALGILLSFIIAGGFFIIPIWVYFH